MVQVLSEGSLANLLCAHMCGSGDFCAYKAKLLQLKLLQIFARDIFLMKKWEIEKTKHTLTISVLKVEY